MLIAMAVWNTEENKRTELTERTLVGLANTVDFDKHRLFISDNGSCEATQTLYKEVQHPPFTLIENGKNIGTAAAINNAWWHRKPGEHCVKMDNDVVIYRPGWIERIAFVFRRDPTIGILGLKRKDIDECPGHELDFYNSTLEMLPHERGEPWQVLEIVQHVMGTCQAYSSTLLDKIGYLTQPYVYGFDDSLAATRARVAGFRSAFLHGWDIDHIDPGGTEYTQWKRDKAGEYMQAFLTLRAQYESRTEDPYCDGGFKNKPTGNGPGTNRIESSTGEPT